MPSRRPPAPTQPAKGAPSSNGAGPAPVVRREQQAYEDALEFLLNRVNIERARGRTVDTHVFKLERTHAILAALGDPHKSFRSVHVAGSKGKGSVCEMTASALQACGLTTGLYTSPHLVDLRERVRINQQVIDHATLIDLVDRLREIVPTIRREHGEPTFFELMTALAFLHFAEQAVDIAVVEVGLGGRFDCTNAITPEVSAITAIQLEHTDILGDTLEKIAAEKAGIIKPGVPCLTIPQQSEGILRVFREKADAEQAPLLVLGKDVDFSYRFEASPELGHHTRICVASGHANFEHFPVPLKGEHQALNAGLALAILAKLRERGFHIKEKDAASGLARTPIAGRLEVLGNAPKIVLDGAHNPESVHALMRAVGSHVRYDSMIVIFGCSSDKNIPGMLARIGAGADKVIFTKASGTKRAVEPRDLLRKFNEVCGKMAQAAPNLKEALAIAKTAVGREDVICITGSFYLAGEAKAYFEERQRQLAAAASVEDKPRAASPRRA